ncbi:MAG: SGNH/GDSL hydrolase family protein [Kiritimatiellae bacterium]|nr:SGNH/GDSL hydrolase family protein [Kiritimatiellia bacterium]MDD5522651.1 SGNH/GDSL hydrolase family protein [Kiritimatiellia bacterium]
METLLNNRPENAHSSVTQNSGCRYIFLILDTLLLLAILAAAAAWSMTLLKISFGSLDIMIPWHRKLLLIPAGIFGLRIGIMLLLKERSKNLNEWQIPTLPVKKITLAITSTFLAFLLIEQIFEFAGYEAEFAPVIIKGAKKRITGTRAIIRDPQLRWKFQPGTEFNGRRINSLGFPEREVDPIKKSGTIRVICMGDSCTGQGMPPYSSIMHEMLTNSPLTEHVWESFNMAVHGYSTAQGLRLFQKQGKALKPDVVTLYYGWNDHWLGGRLPDSKRMVTIGSHSFEVTLFNILNKKRFGQFLLSTFSSNRPLPKDDTSGFRVPPGEYHQTLETFIAEIRAINAIPILLTAPRAETLTGLLVTNGQARSLEETIKAHDLYIEITREIAREHNVVLLDLAAIFSGKDSAGYFQDDGIHLKGSGRKKIAEELYRTLESLVKGDMWKQRKS